MISSPVCTTSYVYKNEMKSIITIIFQSFHMRLYRNQYHFQTNEQYIFHRLWVILYLLCQLGPSCHIRFLTENIVCVCAL